jgi:hypothetical protein
MAVISAFEYRHQRLRVQGRRRAQDRSRQPRFMRKYRCAHDALTSPRSRTSQSAARARARSSGTAIPRFARWCLPSAQISTDAAMPRSSRGFNDRLHAARAQTEGRQHVVIEIPRGHAQLEYFAPAGQWVPRGAVLRCLIDESPLSTSTITRSRSQSSVDSCVPTRAGARRIVFVEDDNAEPPLVEIRDLANGETAHDWR